MHRESPRCRDTLQHQREGKHHRVQLDTAWLREPRLLHVNILNIPPCIQPGLYYFVSSNPILHIYPCQKTHFSLSLWFFRATVAQQRAVFWVNVRSTTLSRGKYGGATHQNKHEETNDLWKFVLIFCLSGKPADLGLASGATAGTADEKPLLLLVMGFLILQMLV